MPNSEHNGVFDEQQDIAPAPGQQVAESWKKCDDDSGAEMPAPPPIWTHFIDGQLKQNCTH